MGNTCDDSKQEFAQILFGYDWLKCQRRAVTEEKMKPMQPTNLKFKVIVKMEVTHNRRHVNTILSTLNTHMLLYSDTKPQIIYRITVMFVNIGLL